MYKELKAVEMVTNYGKNGISIGSRYDNSVLYCKLSSSLPRLINDLLFTGLI